MVLRSRPSKYLQLVNRTASDVVAKHCLQLINRQTPYYIKLIILNCYKLITTKIKIKKNDLQYLRPEMNRSSSRRFYYYIRSFLIYIPITEHSIIPLSHVIPSIFPSFLSFIFLSSSFPVFPLTLFLVSLSLSLSLSLSRSYLSPCPFKSDATARVYSDFPCMSDITALVYSEYTQDCLGIHVQKCSSANDIFLAIKLVTS